MIVVFPDTSPRNIGQLDEHWTVGYGAGHYCNATADSWKKHFNMYDYISKELPQIVENYFPVRPNARAITGFSMGGGAALMIAARNPGMFKSVTAFAPITHPTTAKQFCAQAFAKYFANADDAKHFDTVEVLTSGGKSIKLPPGFVDFASLDKWETDLRPKDFEQALRENGHDMKIRY